MAPKLLTELDAMALLMAGSLGGLALLLTLQFIPWESFQSKDCAFPCVVMLYLYTRNAHRFKEDTETASPRPVKAVPPVAEMTAPPSSAIRREL